MMEQMKKKKTIKRQVEKMVSKKSKSQDKRLRIKKSQC